MKKISFLSICFLLTSCYTSGYCDVSEWKKNEAQSMYNDFGTTVAEMPQDKAARIFGNCYHRGDDIYSYNTLWSKKYILVRYDRAVTYIEESDAVVKGALNDKYKSYNRGGVENQSQPTRQQNKPTQWF